MLRRRVITFLYYRNVFYVYRIRTLFAVMLLRGVLSFRHRFIPLFFRENKMNGRMTGSESGDIFPFDVINVYEKYTTGISNGTNGNANGSHVLSRIHGNRSASQPSYKSIFRRTSTRHEIFLHVATCVRASNKIICNRKVKYIILLHGSANEIYDMQIYFRY